jgi:hypothetical protein
MLNKIELLFIVFTIIIPSCSKDPNSSSSLTEINIEKNAGNFEKLQLSDYISDIKYIPLDNKPVFRRIFQLDFYKDMIAIRDLDYCVLYDSEGRFISKIGNYGKGPGEYLISSNLKMSRDSIFLQDHKYIRVYDLTGNFIRKFEPNLSSDETLVRKWNIINDTLFFGQIPNRNGKEKNKAVVFNDKGEVIKLFPNWIFLDRDQIHYSTREYHANIYKLKGETYFKEIINDTLFVLNENLTLDPLYYFHLGKYGEPVENRELFMTKKSSVNYIHVLNVYESSSYIFIDCDFGNYSPVKRDEPAGEGAFRSEYYTYNVLGVFDKKKEELVFAEPYPIENHFINKGLINDFDGGLKFYPQEMINDSTHAMWIDAYIIKNHVLSEAFKTSVPKYPEKKKQLEKLAASLTGNDNPVLMLVKLKE